MAGLCQSFNEKPRKLGFEAGTVRNLVEAVGRPLAARPELVGERFDVGPAVAGLSERPADRGRATVPFETVECTQSVHFL
jgi:hypothetical protein